MKCDDGTVTRQLLPLDTNGARRMELYKLVRHVTWTVYPCTAEMASGHLAVYHDGCVVRARRGPQGGWLDARFTCAASYSSLMRMQVRGWLLHLGRVHRT